MRGASKQSSWFWLLGSVLGVFVACGTDAASKEGCLVSDDCSEGLVCMDGHCKSAPAGMGGDSSLGMAGGGGVSDAGESSTPPIILSGAGGELGEESCFEICHAARHCPGVNPSYDCEASCSSSAELVAATDCAAEWGDVLRCPVERGPCAACQRELTGLYDCVNAFCADDPDSTYCGL